jgi:subfamily B ATP-binding cassette protein MsbA
MMTEDQADTDAERGAASPQTRGVLGTLWTFIAPRKWQLVGLLFLLTFSSALPQATPQFVRIVLDRLVPLGELRLFLLLGAGMLLFYILRGVVGYAAMYLSYAFTQAVISEIRMRAYSRLLELPTSRFTRERSGSLVARVVSDVNALQTMIQSGATRLFGQLFSIVIVVVILLVMNWRLALVSFVMVAVVSVITALYQRPLRNLARGIRGRVGELTATATEAIGNVGVVKSFAAEGFEVERFGAENDRYVDLNLERRKQVGWMEGLVGLTTGLGTSALLLAGGWLIVGGKLSVGELSAFLLYLRNLIGPVTSVLFFNNSLQAGMAALERVSDLLDDIPESEGDVTARPGGEVAFEWVYFHYPGAEVDALQGLSFKVAAGQTAALVGPSGAGKSTVSKLLSRLYDPQAGNIRLGGRDVRDYRLKTLRRAVAVVEQDPTLFSGSVLDNIRYAEPTATGAEVEEAARLANAHTFVLELPKGYDTEVGERGVKLSGGQKQRIAIARAILKDASLLILDEATSNLDMESEAVIRDALEGLFARRHQVTTLIIAHRLSTVQRAGRIFVLEHGRIAEAGSHAELLAEGGLYRTLYDLQFVDEALLTREARS